MRGKDDFPSSSFFFFIIKEKKERSGRFLIKDRVGRGSLNSGEEEGGEKIANAKGRTYNRMPLIARH